MGADQDGPAAGGTQDEFSMRSVTQSPGHIVGPFGTSGQDLGQESPGSWCLFQSTAMSIHRFMEIARILSPQKSSSTGQKICFQE